MPPVLRWSAKFGIFLKLSPFLLFIIFLLPPRISAAIGQQCKRVGAEELVDEEGCELLIVRVNRCSGYCFSLTYPSPRSGKTAGVSKCCRMTDTEWVNAELTCIDGPKQIRIPSALQCECFDCPIN
ncbi:unnamed protein product [Auanema sp. JU1783]|nr:unnamed protein product [Auanema sp. JU1783]